MSGEGSPDFGVIARLLSDGFNRLDNRLDELNRRLDQKADNSRVAEIEKRHADHELRIEDRFDEVDKRFKPLEDFLLTNSAISFLRGRVLGGLWLAAVAIIGAFFYEVFSGGIH